MKIFDIRSRMLIAVLLPVILMAFLLAGVFVVSRMGDVEKAHDLQTQSLIRQLSVASEYGLFSANVVQLETVALGAMTELDVMSVVIVDDRGSVMASTGKRVFTNKPDLRTYAGINIDSAGRIEQRVQPVFASPVKLDDGFDPIVFTGPVQRHLLGHVLVEFSRDSLLARERDILLLGLAVSLLGLLFGCILALRLGQTVVQPILRVSSLIERIGRGEFSARSVVLAHDPLRDLQVVLNQMAERLETSRDDLEHRIDLATVALREKKEEAEQATLAKSRFLAAASHDLRQPTHALGMFVARLAQLPHDPQTYSLIENLERSVLAMQNLLDALLDISRLEARAVPVQLSRFALDDVFEQLRTGFSLLASDKRLRLHVRTTPVWVLSDPILLYQILMNLLMNALRYTQSGGVVIACRVSAGAQTARIEVWDSGIGIAPEHQQSIFTEFFQVGNTERNQRKGLGLGLNIVQRTAQLLGHPLQICSRLGQGSRFSIVLPLVAAGVTSVITESLEQKSVNSLDGYKVLLVEDDQLALTGLASLLESWGAEVYAAESFVQAMGHIEVGLVPDLIISDYRLPGAANGIESVQQLRAALGQHTPACLISGDMDDGLLRSVKEAQLTLLHKPVRPAKLRSLIRSLIRDVAVSSDRKS
jgi:signal transduction histidine kinase/ActR/RegA family two-component response regulator